MLKKSYSLVFWIGYLLVFITALINVGGTYNDYNIRVGFFRIRLDHMLHFTVYLFICIYYFVGQLKGLYLFSSHPLRKFILLVFLLASVTEIIQLWAPGRSFSMLDMTSNLAGLGTGIVIIIYNTNDEKLKRLLVKDKK